MSGKHTHPPGATGKQAFPRDDAALQRLVSHFESQVGSETAPAQFREPRRPRRGPEPAWASAAPAQQVTRAPWCPAPPAPPTYDFRAAVTAGVLKARLALLVGPVPEARVLNLQGRDGPKSEAKSAAPPARPPAPRGADKSKQSLRADRCRGEIAHPAARRRGAPGGRAAQTFLSRGPLRTRRGLRAGPPHLTFAAQLPEKLLVFELASLVGHDARHLPALRPCRPGSGLARAPAGGLRADRLTAHPRCSDSRFPLFQAPARVGSRSRESKVPPLARAQPTPPQPLPTARADPTLATPGLCHRRHFLSPPTSLARRPRPRRPHLSSSRARPPQTPANKTHHSQLCDPRRACATRPLAGQLGCSEPELLSPRSPLSLTHPGATHCGTALCKSARSLEMKRPPWAFLSTVRNFCAPQPRGVTPNCDLNAWKFKSLGALRPQRRRSGCKLYTSKTKGGNRPKHPTEFAL